MGRSPIAVVAQAAEPMQIDPALAQELSAVHSRLVRNELPGGLAPSLRTAFKRRLNHLSLCLAPASIDSIEMHVAVLMASFFSARRVSDEEAKVTTRAYAFALEGLPLWAVAQACRAVARGAVPGVNKDFAPAAPRVRDVANALIEPHVTERNRLLRVLEAKEGYEPTPEERERVKARFAALKIRIGGAEMQPIPRATSRTSDGKHAQRVAADLAARKARSDLLAGRKNSEAC